MAIDRPGYKGVKSVCVQTPFDEMLAIALVTIMPAGLRNLLHMQFIGGKMQAKAALTARTHYPALDGLRGLAILLVMSLHMMVMEPTNGFQSALYETAQIGWIGVDLFFVLSGFLITGILIDSKDRPDYFRTFYKRRILRIFPLFYAVAIFSFVVLPHLPFIPAGKLARFGTVGDDEILYWTFLSNFAIVNFGGAFRHGIMDVTWSLSIEEQFYLVWPLIIMLFSKRIIPICIGLIVISLTIRMIALSQGWPYNSIYVFTFCRFDGLAAGAIMASLVRSMKEDERLCVWAGWASAFGSLGFLVCALIDGSFSYYDSPSISTLGFTFLAIGFGGILGRVYLGPPKAKFASLLSTSAMRFFGKISYALYLFHLPVRAAVRDLLMSPQWIAAFPLGGVAGQLLFYATATGISCLLAWLSFELYEKHFLKLGR